MWDTRLAELVVRRPHYDPGVVGDLAAGGATSARPRIVAGLTDGHDVDLLDDSGERSPLSASDLRGALLETAERQDPRPFRLSGAAVTGSLDLRNVDLRVGLTVNNCVFDEPLLLDGARLQALALVDCPEVPGVSANGCSVRLDVVLDNAHITGALASIGSMRQTAAVWLCEATIGGRLLIRNGTVLDGCGGRSVQADRIVVGANVRILAGSMIKGEMRLLSARVAGSLDVVSSTVATHATVALEMAEAKLGGGVFLARTTPDSEPARIDGLLTMSDVTFGAFVSIKGAELCGRRIDVEGPYDRPNRHARTVAILAPRCEIGDDLHIDGATVVTGGLVLPNATVLGDVLVDEVVVANPEDRALDLGGAEVKGSVLARNFTSLGLVWLAGVTIDGGVDAAGATLGRTSGDAVLVGSGMTLGGDLQLSGVTATGGSIRLRGAQIAGEVNLEDADLQNSDGETLSIANTHIGGPVRLRRLRSVGHATISRTTIAGRLQLRDAELSSGGEGEALEIFASRVEGGVYLDWAELEPSVSLYSSSTTILADWAPTWPSRAELSGFTYQRLDSPKSVGPDPWDVARRLEILACQDPFDLAPYEVAARVYAEHGRLGDADRIRIAGRRRAANEKPDGQDRPRFRSMAARAGSWLYDVTLGFGFRPGRALGLITVLAVAVWLSLTGPWSASDDVMRAPGASGAVYGPSGVVHDVDDAGAGVPCGRDLPCFRASIYALETVAPLVDLGQRDVWHVDGNARFGWLYEVWLTFATLAGWALTTVFVLSFSRLGRTT